MEQVSSALAGGDVKQSTFRRARLAQRSGAMRASPAVLVVEDDVRLAQVLVSQLADAGFAPTVAPSRARAEAALAERSWAGVLLDVGLPDGNGIALIAAIRRCHGSIPVLVMTGGDVAQHTHVALEQTAMFVTKPLPQCWLRVFSDAVSGASGRPSPTDALRMLGLTSAQLEVFSPLIEGRNAAEVAALLGVQVTTVRTHCANVCRDLHVSGLTGVLAMAAGWGRVAG